MSQGEGPQMQDVPRTSTRDPEQLESFGAEAPLGRAGQPAEVAPAYVFLASPKDASYVSGSILGVTGGKATF